jgi:hypothetical protein
MEIEGFIGYALKHAPTRALRNIGKAECCFFWGPAPKRPV